MTKQKGVISVYKAILIAWNDEVEQCRKYGMKDVIHMNTFYDRVKAYVNGGSKDGIQVVNKYRPSDTHIHRQLQQLRTDGLINYEYKDEV